MCAPSPPFPPGFKLIDESLQVAGVGAGAVGVPGTLLRAPPGLWARRVEGSASLPEGEQRLTSAHPGLGGLHPKVIVSPSRFPAQQLAWRRPAGLGIPAPPGWLVHNLCSSFTARHPHPAKTSKQEKSPTQPAPGGAISLCLCGRTPLGDLLEDVKSQTFL